MAIQYKFPANKDNYEKLRTAKIILSNTVQHKYTYFMSQQRNGKKVLTRVRETNGHSFLDCKKLNKITEEWNKTEVPVGDYANTIKILKTSGLEEIAELHKTFRSWENEFIKIDLVEIIDMFSVIEVKFEINNKANAHEFIKKIGLDLNNIDKRSSVDIYLSMRGE